MRPEPNTFSTEVVIDTTLPHRSTTTKCEVPPGSRVASAPRGLAPAGTPGAGLGPKVSPISMALWAAKAGSSRPSSGTDTKSASPK